MEEIVYSDTDSVMIVSRLYGPREASGLYPIPLWLVNDEDNDDNYKLPSPPTFNKKKYGK